MPSPSQTLRLAEVLGALSLATDLANGNPLETALRTCLLAVELAREAGGTEQEVSDAYDAAMLRYVGCTAYASEEAEAMGREFSARDTPSHLAGATGHSRLRGGGGNRSRTGGFGPYSDHRLPPGFPSEMEGGFPSG